jgi:DNA-directed RNA polymerase
MEDTISKIDAKVIRGELDRNPFGETEAQQRASAAFMAHINYDAVQRILSSVSAGMKFFSGVAGILAHEGKHLKFKNKIDFPMQQKYTHWQVKKVRIFLYDRVASLTQDKPIHRRSQLSVRTQNPKKVDKKKSKSAVSANLIHSQDSCHLLSTVLHMEREYKLNNFFLIHDAFATVPNDVEYMYTSVRESFINLYKDYCLFSDVASQASKQLTDAGQLKLLNLEIPTKGDLDLMAVKDAQYCFC